MLSATASASTSVAARGVQNISRAASGQVTLYNAYGTAPQPLITNTRFEAQNGKIYRIHKAVTIPGGTKKPDGSLTPGSVVVTIYADAPGADYNQVQATQFNIPGFKDDPRYGKIVATATSAIGGGLVGTEPIVAPSVLTQAKALLAKEIETTASTAAAANIPQGYILVDHSLTLTYHDLVQTPADTGTATLSQSADASVVIVRADDLAQVLATPGGLTSGASSTVSFVDASTIHVAMSDQKRGSSLSFTLSGSPTVLWHIDAAAVARALMGKEKAGFTTALKTLMPALECSDTKPCNATIRPFWKKAFPSNPQKIKVEIKN